MSFRRKMNCHSALTLIQFVESLQKTIIGKFTKDPSLVCLGYCQQMRASSGTDPPEELLLSSTGRTVPLETLLSVPLPLPEQPPNINDKTATERLRIDTAILDFIVSPTII